MENFLVNFLIRAVRKLYYFPKKILGEIFFGANKVLNDGERFDPFLSSFQYKDKCHLPRYEFAGKLIDADDEVLDIACGTGYGSRMLAEAARKVTGVDVSEAAIEYAAEKSDRPNLTFVRSDFFENPVRADVVVSFETIEHLKVDSMNPILEKLHSFAKRTIIGSIPYMEKRGANPHHYLFDLDESSVEFLRSSGQVEFYYQMPGGEILKDKPGDGIQNLLFVFHRNQPE